jgi:ABC-type nitrate/sulfonate/bicarbonate transport system permease component
MLVSILTLALLGKSADSLLRLLEGKLLGWSDTFGERR